MKLSHLPAQTLPREKLLARGAASLSDAELLAIILRTGMAGKNVLQMAQEVLDTCGGLAGLLHADAVQLKRIKGLGGNAKRAELLAVMELARRAVAQQMQKRTNLGSPELAMQYVQMQLGQQAQECFAVLFLDTHHRLICMETLFTGTLNQASVYPREVAARALHHQAASVMLAHNHPSGQVEPSAADRALTQRLQQALGLLDIAVLDHLIVAPGQAVSMAQQGYMPTTTMANK
ncbi:MAG: DNA repair protein RadC [Brachymonas sp.]|nr:DNA repair protein RadC [Brachymonas sp.]